MYRKQNNQNEFFGHILSYIRYRNKKDPFADFVKLRNGEILPEAKRGTILLFPFRVAPVSNLFEGILGYAFRLRGYKVVTLMCGKYLKYCDHINCLANKFLDCPLCLYEQKRFSSTFALDDVWFNELLSEEKLRQLEHHAHSVALSNISKYVYEGVQIGKHVLSAVQRHTLSCDPNLQKNEALFRGFFLSALITVEVVRTSIKKYKPEIIISSHGVYSTWGSAIETAVTDNIRCVTWGRGYIGGQIMASHDSSYLLANMNEPNSLWESERLTSRQRESTLKYFQLKRDPMSGVDHINYYKSKSTITKESLFEKLKLNPQRKRLGLYPSIPWDAQTFTSSEAFPKIEAWVQYTIDWIEQHPDVDLIIRSHPAEIRRKGNITLETFESILKELYPKLPPNVKFISPGVDDISSYIVSEICEAALMYGSTLGLEFAVVGHPVINAGRIQWSNKGIVFDVNSLEEYRMLLEKASSGKLKMSSEMQERAIKYAHHWVFNKHMPETIINHDSLIYTGYKINTAMELKPGDNKTVDCFIDCCLNGKPFHWVDD